MHYSETLLEGTAIECTQHAHLPCKICMRAVLRKKGTTQNYVFLKHVPQLTTGPFRFKRQHKQTKLSNIGASNTQILHETELHPLRVTLWCAVSSRCIVGPYFQDENGHTVTVTGNRYFSMLREFFYPELRRMRIWWCSSSHSPTCYDRIATKTSQ